MWKCVIGHFIVNPWGTQVVPNQKNKKGLHLYKKILIVKTR